MKPFLLALTIFLTAVACSLPNASHESTVDMPNTNAKQQVVGNCWAYATIGWIEAYLVRAGHEEPDLSESYLLYRHFQSLLTEMTPNTPTSAHRLNPSGTFATARWLISNFGIVAESHFLTSEGTLPDEAAALATLDESLETGPLAGLFSPSLSPTDRSDLIRTELDAAFRVNLSQAIPHIMQATSLTLTTSAGDHSLRDEIYRWEQVEFPLNLDDLPQRDAQLPRRAILNAAQISLLQRVFRALNRHDPVLLAWLVDTNALGADGSFSAASLQRNGGPGDQGLHLTVIEDYLVHGQDPQTNQPFSTPEGETSSQLKDLAATYGILDAIIVKNSWGTGARWSRGGQRGFNLLAADYLLAWIPRHASGRDLVLRGFVLPREP